MKGGLTDSKYEDIWAGGKWGWEIRQLCGQLSREKHSRKQSVKIESYLTL